MTSRRPLLLALAAASGALALRLTGGVARAAEPPPFKLIVHPENPVTEATRRFLADSFLKKTTRWPSGEVIHPVDLGADSPVRRRFSEDVLNRSVAAVKSYWQQVIFSGRGVPPPELSTDDEVVSFVMRHPGGLGYVSGGADIGSAKTIVVS